MRHYRTSQRGKYTIKLAVPMAILLIKVLNPIQDQASIPMPVLIKDSKDRQGRDSMQMHSINSKVVSQALTHHKKEELADFRTYSGIYSTAQELQILAILKHKR